MSITSLLGARLGLEELVDEVPDINPAALSTDAEMVEMEKAHQEVNATEAKAIMLDTATDSLERIALALEKISTPTISAESAALINLAYENAMHPIARYESGDSAHGGQSQGGNTTEKEKKSLMEKITEAWEAFVMMLTKIWDALSNFFLRLFSTAGMMRRKAEALLKTARSVKENAKATAFTMNVNELQVDGKVLTPDETARQVKQISKLFYNVLVGKDSLMSGSFIKEYKKEVEKIAKPVPRDATFDTHGDKDAHFFAMRDVENLRLMLATSVAKAAKAGGIGKIDTGAISKQYSESSTVRISDDTLFGDKVFVFISSPGEKSQENKHAQFTKWLRTLKFDVASTESPKLERVEVEPLSISNIADILGEVINICQDVEIYKKQWFVAKQTSNELNKLLLDYIRKNVKGVYLTEEERKKTQEWTERKNKGENIPLWETLSFAFKLDYIKAQVSILKSTQTAVTTFSNFEGKVSKMAMRNSHALITYSQKSLNAHIGNPNDDFEAGPNATKNSKGYQEHERAAPGSKGFTSSRDDIDDAVLV